MKARSASIIFPARLSFFGNLADLLSRWAQWWSRFVLVHLVLPHRLAPRSTTGRRRADVLQGR
jgi:hypothetical protein